jgi:hypothetical protein
LVPAAVVPRYENFKEGEGRQNDDLTQVVTIGVSDRDAFADLPGRVSNEVHDRS